MTERYKLMENLNGNPCDWHILDIVTDTIIPASEGKDIVELLNQQNEFIQKCIKRGGKLEKDQ